MKKIAHVVLGEHFTYIENYLSYFFDTEKLDVKIGDTVLVPFGQKKLLEACIVDIVEYDENGLHKLKEIIKKLPYSLPESCITVSRQMAEYYFAPLQTCLRLFFPKKIWNGQFEIKKESFWSLSGNINPEMLEKIRGEKQQNILQFLQTQDGVEQSFLLQQTSASLATCKALEEKGLLIKTEKTPDSTPFTINENAFKSLTEDQTLALEQIKKSSISLLHGVTGAGKTEVFLHFFRWILEQEKTSQCLFLVPEIALTPQMIAYIKNAFPVGIEIIHSQVSDGEKCRIWTGVESGKVRLIIGSRSALFMPWKNLKCIVMDEEHEWTYKSDQTPKYNAKKIAEWTLNLPAHHSPLATFLILASATPDVCDMFLAKQGEIQLVELKSRINTELPEVHIIDMREEFLRKNFSPLSENLQYKIKKVLERGKQVVLFLNKRGFSHALQCHNCGEIIMCPHCDIPMTYHAKNGDGKLMCHYCFLMKEAPNTCPNCKALNLKQKGFGTQKIEEELQKLFPQTRILRADRDSTANKGDFEKIYNAMKVGEADILLGTQMISKGLDLENVDLVGVISADMGLHIPDFRSSEKVFQLLTQVAGRAGRKNKGEVVFQTFMPHHEVIQAASLHNYARMYEQLMEERKILKYPPFSKVIKLTFVNSGKKLGMQTSQALKQTLSTLVIDHSSLIISSAPSFVPKVNEKYYWNVIIRGDSPELALRELINTKPEFLNGWRIDRDPVFLS